MIYSFRTFEVIASQLNLESSWQPRFAPVLCSLMEWLAKDILISLKSHLVLSYPK